MAAEEDRKAVVPVTEADLRAIRSAQRLLAQSRPQVEAAARVAAKVAESQAAVNDAISDAVERASRANAAQTAQIAQRWIDAYRPSVDAAAERIVRANAVQTAQMAQRLLDAYRPSINEALARFSRDIAGSILDAPGWQAFRERLLEAREAFWPANWRGITVDWRRAWAIAKAEGIPLVWVPRSEIVLLLVEAPDAATRSQVLSTRAADINEDCAAVAESVVDPGLAEYRHLVTRALDAHREGHVEAAQALAAAVFTALLERVYSHGKLSKVAKSTLRSKAPNDPRLSRLRAALLIEAALPAVHAGGNRVPDDETPATFNRNLTLHRASARQYAETHAITALMLTTALLAEAQELRERGILAAS